MSINAPNRGLNSNSLEARLLSRSEVKDMCEKLPDVQALTDEAAAEVERDSPGLSPGAYGTAVHKYVEHEINISPDPNFRAEKSTLKIAAAVTAETMDRLSRGEDPVHSALDTVRIDVYENRENGLSAYTTSRPVTACSGRGA